MTKDQPSDWIRKFTAELSRLEENQDPSRMPALFSKECEISNLAIPSMSGIQGVEEFWKRYLDAFQDVRTCFTRAHECDENTAILEWESAGKLPSGREFSYEGITVLENKAGKITRMKAYYDTSIFTVPHLHPAVPPGNASTEDLMRGQGRDQSTPGEGILTSKGEDFDAATG